MCVFLRYSASHHGLVDISHADASSFPADCISRVVFLITVAKVQYGASDVKFFQRNFAAFS